LCRARSLCAQPPAQSVGVHVVRERLPAVDLDHRQPFAIAGLQRRVAADVDLEKVELDLLLHPEQDIARTLAQVAVLRVIQNDAVRYG
jgi:hypothetical protein